MIREQLRSKCLNVHFQRDYEYIHDIACDEKGEYIYVICTNSLKIYKYEEEEDEFNLLVTIKSPHDDAILRCIICPIVSEQYSLFATISEDNTIGIWLLNKNVDIIKSLQVENININIPFEYSMNESVSIGGNRSIVGMDIYNDDNSNDGDNNVDFDDDSSISNKERVDGQDDNDRLSIIKSDEDEDKCVDNSDINLDQLVINGDDNNEFKRVDDQMGDNTEVVVMIGGEEGEKDNDNEDEGKNVNEQDQEDNNSEIKDKYMMKRVDEVRISNIEVDRVDDNIGEMEIKLEENESKDEDENKNEDKEDENEKKDKEDNSENEDENRNEDSESESEDDNEGGSVKREISRLSKICRMTARLRDSVGTIVSSSFVLNYENSGWLSLNVATSVISLVVLSVDGLVRIYTCQDPPLFHIWSIIEQFRCSISPLYNHLRSFSMMSNLNILGDEIYTIGLMAIGTNGGLISVYCKSSLLEERGEIMGTSIMEDNSSWKCLFETKNTTTTCNSDTNNRQEEAMNEIIDNDVIELKWCPNYTRRYEILASSFDSFIYFNDNNKQQVDEDNINIKINGIPWIGIWKWELYDKNHGNLTLVYILINQLDYPTTSISWDNKGTEFLACTDEGVTRFVQYDNNSTRVHWELEDDFVAIDSLIFNNRRKSKDDIHGIQSIMMEFPLFIKFIRPV
ncbi:hypothetical protein OJ252_1163 [Cryptosporidium canis]|uniref:WD repeat-containing protein 75 second beta-propeller domain-containing protein n=1 Tax=Cryptosporidium canis TaxID=195482 RepID=A0ABQ8P9A1_9CRYT|nr:hypothetical protein OJ252_1163 [Cryptosporidium canis]